jgi:DNA-binding CsgD family transcriptional regulator
MKTSPAAARRGRALEPPSNIAIDSVRLNHPLRVNRTSPGMRLIGRSHGARKTPYSLTARECEVLEWVARGKPAREIAEILNITKRTVDAHVHSAIRKIGAVNRTNAVAIAIRDRIIDV